MREEGIKKRFQLLCIHTIHTPDGVWEAGLRPWTLSRLIAKTRREREDSAAAVSRVCCYCHFLKLQQMNLKIQFHPAQLSKQWALNEIPCVPVMLRGQGPPWPPEQPRCAIQTLSFSTCTTAWKTAGLTAIYNQPRPVKEAHWKDFIPIISNIDYWHFTRQLEVFHLVYLLAYLRDTF